MLNAIWWPSGHALHLEFRACGGKEDGSRGRGQTTSYGRCSRRTGRRRSGGGVEPHIVERVLSPDPTTVPRAESAARGVRRPRNWE
jgi:hypothetical protein